MTIIYKSNGFVFLLSTILLPLLYGCGSQDTEVKTPTTTSYRELTAEESFEFEQNRAMSGNAEAQYKLGEMYYNENPFGDERVDTVVPKDDSKAAEWYQKAAEQGLTEAQSSLA